MGSCCCFSVSHSCLNLCNPMDCSTPGFAVLHYLLELAQTHVHWVGDAIQLSHPLSPASNPALNLSQHQDIFQWVSSSYQVDKGLELQIQHQSFQWIFGVDFLLDWLAWSSLLSKELSRVFSSTTFQKHQSFSAQPSLWSNSHIHTWLLEKSIALTIWTFIGDVISLLFNMLPKFVIAFLPRNMEWGHLGTDENTLCLDFGTGCMSLDICPNSSECTARRNKFNCV